MLLLDSAALPRAFARLALVLGAAFALAGFIGVFLPAATAATAGLSGLQVLWIIAAAISLEARMHRGPQQRLGPEPAYERTST